MTTMEIEQAARMQRAIQIAKTKRVVKRGSVWVVPSQAGLGSYVVDNEDEGGAWRCSCPDYEDRELPCKHIICVEVVRFQSVPTAAAKTLMSVQYTQDWPRYNAAQCSEKRDFERLLRDLVGGIAQPPQACGRPRLPLNEVIFAAGMKVYSTQSARRATTAIAEAAGKGLISKAPSYNSILRYMENPALTPVLEDLILVAASPLKKLEHEIAIDSTGMTSAVYERWVAHKYGRREEKSEVIWVKLHGAVGVRTNVFTAACVTPSNVADCNKLPALLDATAQRFDMTEVSADKAYLSHANVAAIEHHGAVPYIDVKSNVSGGRVPSGWRTMIHQFMFRRDEFRRHYHKRSNVETAFSMVKAKFGANIRVRTPAAQVNEVLLKVLCHNVVVVASAMHELEIDPTFDNGPVLQ